MITYIINHAIHRGKIAAFDYDWTLVNPKDGKTFPKDLDDWVWYYSNIPDKIKQLYDDGFMIVIFTNQTKKWKCEQINIVAKSLNIPLFVVIAMKKSEHKPNPIMFNTLFKDNEIIKNKSFFVGDALGRKIDFSDSDKIFAETIGINYHSPEDIFYIKTNIIIPEIKLSDSPKIIIMMGYPGSGKSTIAKHICKNENYICIQRDIYKTIPKMKKKAMEYVLQKKSIIFDATNSSIKNRNEYIQFANKYNYEVVCIHVATSLEISFKRNRLRDESNQVPKIAYSVYSKYYNQPNKKEGFTLMLF